MAPMVALIAHVSIKPDCINQFLALAEGMLEPSRAENACIAYDYFTKPNNPQQLVFVEEWTDRNGLEEHFQTPHFMAFQQANKALIDSVQISIYHAGEVERL